MSRSAVCALSGSIVITLAAGQPAGGEVVFVDIASETGLDFACEYGPTFPTVTFQWPAWLSALIQRNLGNGAAVEDYDGDGDLDVYLVGNLGHSSVLYRNDLNVNGQFTDVTAEAGVEDTGLGRLGAFADLDNDGHPDLIVLNDTMTGESYPASRIFRNLGDGTFADVTPGSGFTPVGYVKGGIGLGDYDGDGLVDIYVANWCGEVGVTAYAFEGLNRLYRNLGGFQFQDVTDAAGLGVIQRDSFTSIFADFDEDGDLDLYVAVDTSSDVYYRNDGGVFVNDTVAVGADHMASDMGACVADVDRDGDLDVYSTNVCDWSGSHGTPEHNIFLINQLVETGTMTFVDVAPQLGMEDTAWGWGCEWVDVDLDRDLDLYAVNGFDEYIDFFNQSPHLVDAPNVLFINDGTTHFTTTTGTGAELTHDSKAVIAADFDRDGRIDMLVTNTAEPCVLLRNQTPTLNRWLIVDPVGGGVVNRDGFGTKVFLTTGGTTQRLDVIGGGSYLAGRPTELHFGLGNASHADEIRVRWPDGSEQVFSNIPSNQRLVVDRLDLDANLEVDGGDIGRLFAGWGTDDPVADLDGDDTVDVDDLIVLFTQWR